MVGWGRGRRICTSVQIRWYIFTDNAQIICHTNAQHGTGSFSAHQPLSCRDAVKVDQIVEWEGGDGAEVVWSCDQPPPPLS